MGGQESSKAFSEGCGAGDHVVDFDTDGWVPRTEGLVKGGTVEGINF